MSREWVAAVALAALLASVASAGDSASKMPPRVHARPYAIAKYCCDDYRSKCLPITKPPCRFVCDDYLPKCAPRVKPVGPFVCDDYCSKPAPRLNCQRIDDLRCPPPIKHSGPKGTAK